MKLVFGLGNPGERYAKTRHNAGFLALDVLQGALCATAFGNSRGAQVAQAFVGGEKVLLIKPQTFMNNSGDCVLDFAAYYRVESTDLLVIFDDIDLPNGVVRVREKGGPGTHNGMRDIVQKIGTTLFPRVRIGVGHKPPQWDLVDHVLGVPQDEQWTLFVQGIRNAAGAAACALREGVQSAMRYNGTQPKPKEGGSHATESGE